MSILVLVRHGQAAAFSESPDRLTATGWEQARSLGRHWIEQNARFDAAYHGSLRRQRESCEAVEAEFQKAGVPFPETQVLPGLDEYGAQDMVASIAPRLAGQDPEFAPLWDAWLSAPADGNRNRHFQVMFEALMARWAEGSLDEPDLESWEDFRHRVTVTLQLIRDTHPSGRRVVAFTSGGPIGVAVQECLEAPPAAALSLNWRVRNTSLTTFLYSGSRLSLDAFNELPHMSRTPHLVTFR